MRIGCHSEAGGDRFSCPSANCLNTFLVLCNARNTLTNANPVWSSLRPFANLLLARLEPLQSVPQAILIQWIGNLAAIRKGPGDVLAIAV